jgi:hypothetical protein
MRPLFPHQRCAARVPTQYDPSGDRSYGDVNVRYMVQDVEAAVAFYTTHFGFALGTNAAPAFADVIRGDVQLLLSGPLSSAGRPMPDGRTPALQPGSSLNRPTAVTRMRNLLSIS